MRYVVDKSAVDGLDAQIKTPNPQTDTLINSEVEILTSSDLAREVAQTIGVEKLVPNLGAKATLEDATKVILRGLDISVVKGTNIISRFLQGAAIVPCRCQSCRNSSMDI